jgi:hypothetical protein
MEIGGALKDLRILWEETKAVWNDPVRDSFEEHQWIPLETSVLAGIRAMNQLAPIMEKLRQDCGEGSLDL